MGDNKEKDPVQEYEEWVFDPQREDGVPPIFMKDYTLIEDIKNVNDKITVGVVVVISLMVIVLASFWIVGF